MLSVVFLACWRSYWERQRITGTDWTVKFQNKVSIRKGFTNRRVGCTGLEIRKIQQKANAVNSEKKFCQDFQRHSVFRPPTSPSGGSETAAPGVQRLEESRVANSPPWPSYLEKVDRR
jgi:hypothetical protein